jgi:hypothetical protein
MAIVKLFAERERARLGKGEPDVLTYNVPERLRIQFIHIWQEAIGHQRIRDGYDLSPPDVGDFAWPEVEKVLKKELGVLKLADGSKAEERVLRYFLRADDVHALSVAELFFVHIEGLVRQRQIQDDGFIAEANGRFRQNAVGYQYEAGEIMRVDSLYAHDQVVKPALVLLAQRGFEGANDEFLKAHAHYRSGQYKSAVNEALKAFESIMKCICDERGIRRDPAWSASSLIKAMFDNEVIPRKLESHLAGVRAALESGLPTVRNKDAGHGQGQDVIEMPRYVAGHALHLAAANIVLLVESHLANPKK